MKNVSFPGLGLEFGISNIAFSVFGIEIYWYAICIVLGIVTALVLAYLSKEKFEIDFFDIIDIAIYAIIAGVIGARLYYVMFNLPYYISNPLKIFALRDGGLGIYGGLILGTIVGIYKAKKINVNVFNGLDYTVPYIALAQAFGRWGNFFNVEAYGEEYSGLLRMQVGEKTVHPTFLYESTCTCIIFLLLRFMQKKRKFKGQIFYLYIILYSFVRFWIEGLRSDSLMLFQFRISQVVSVIAFFVSCICYVISRKKALKA